MIDWDEMREGFSFSGKHQRLRDWRVAKDAKEFRRLCKCLWARKCRIAVRAEGGARLSKLRKSQRDYARRNRAKNRDALNTEKRARSLRKYVASAPTYRCKECNCTFSRVPWCRNGLRPKFCRKKCSQRFWRARLLRDVAAAPTYCCKECNCTFSRVPWCRSGPRPKFCGANCSQRFRYKPKTTPGRPCTVCGVRGHNKRTCPRGRED